MQQGHVSVAIRTVTVLEGIDISCWRGGPLCRAGGLQQVVKVERDIPPKFVLLFHSA